MSEISHLKDRHGNDMYFGDTGEIWVAPGPGLDDFRGQLQKLRHMELRDGDVILASFPRSGTFWNHQILVMLMNGTTEYLGNMDRDHFDWCPYDKLVRPERPWVYATHLRFRLLPQQVKEKKVKIIYAYRNPKDSWVSCYNFVHNTKLMPAYEGTWSHYFDLMMDCGFHYGNWFDHVLDWEKASREHPDLIFPSCYELMKKDPVGQIMKIDQFLGLNRGRQLCEQIAEACKFSAMKTVKEARGQHIHGEQAWKEGGPRVYRKGEIGDWHNWFTAAQSDQLDALFKKRMAGSKLPFFFE